MTSRYKREAPSREAPPRYERMTLGEAKRWLKAFNVVLKKNFRDNEYEVKVKGQPSSTTYFTNDLADAVQTGERMGREFFKFVHVDDEE